MAEKRHLACGVLEAAFGAVFLAALLAAAVALCGMIAPKVDQQIDRTTRAALGTRTL
jgi:hypothetical protein